MSCCAFTLVLMRQRAFPYIRCYYKYERVHWPARVLFQEGYTGPSVRGKIMVTFLGAIPSWAEVWATDLSPFTEANESKKLARPKDLTDFKTAIAQADSGDFDLASCISGCVRGDESSQMVCCDSCARWVHTECVGLGDTTLADDFAYSCWRCSEQPVLRPMSNLEMPDNSSRLDLLDMLARTLTEEMTHASGPLRAPIQKQLLQCEAWRQDLHNKQQRVSVAVGMLVRHSVTGVISAVADIKPRDASNTAQCPRDNQCSRLDNHVGRCNTAHDGWAPGGMVAELVSISLC